MTENIKKLLCTVLSAAILFGALTALSTAAVNGSRLTVSDARNVLRAAVNLQPLSAEDKRFADLDFDGNITVSDARAVLRLAVSLDLIDGKTYNNEYEMLSSGHYSFSGIYTEKESKETFSGPVSLAITANTLKMDVSGVFSAVGGDMSELDELFELLGADGFKISSVMFANNKISLISESTKESLSFPASEMGDDFKEIMTEMQTFIPGLHKSLSEASSKKNAVYKGKSCTVYTFVEKEAGVVSFSSEVYMFGNKLMKIDYFNNRGFMFKSIEFNTLSRIVAVGDTNLNGYNDTSVNFGI